MMNLGFQFTTHTMERNNATSLTFWELNDDGKQNNVIAMILLEQSIANVDN